MSKNGLYSTKTSFWANLTGCVYRLYTEGMTKSYVYNVRIKPETLPELQKLSNGLDFRNQNPGYRHGQPSPAALLDALAAAYRANPTAVTAALRGLGVVGQAEPAAG